MSFRPRLRLALVATRLVAVAGLWSAVHAWTTPERVDRKPDNYVVYLCDIAASRGGTPHVVWSECPSGTYYEKIMYARKLQDTWSIPINISRDSGDLRMPDIVMDNTGMPLVVWWEEGHGWFRYVRPVGDTWSVPKLAFSQGAAIPRLALDIRGQIHLLFDGSNGVWHSRYVNEADSWTTPDRVAAGNLSWQDIATDRSGHLHAVWMDYNTYGLGYSLYDGKRWSEPEPLPDPAPGSYQSCDPRIATDVNRRPHVVWQERAGGYILYYTERSADTWTTPYRLFGPSGGRQSILADSTDRLHVVWDWDYGVRYIMHTASGWTDPVSVTDSNAFVYGFTQSAARFHVVMRQNWGVWYSEHDLDGIGDETPDIGARLPLRACRSGSGYRLEFFLVGSGDARLELADALGRIARVVRLGRLSPGRHQVELSLDSVPSGVYFCRLLTGTESGIQKLVVDR